MEFLWLKGRESSDPSRHREPDPSLGTAAKLARHNLVSRMFCLALVCLQRDILHALAPAAQGLHKADLM